MEIYFQLDATIRERDYGELFDRNCSKYPHYVDAVKYGIGLIDSQPCKISYTALNTYIFNPVGIYAQSDGTPVIFNSGCTIAVIMHTSDFVNKTHVSKLMNGLGGTTKVIGGGVLNWNFRGDYGFLQWI